MAPRRAAAFVAVAFLVGVAGGLPCRNFSPSAIVMTWCPPNWPRSAATACIVGELDWREAKRAKSEAEMTGIGTERAMASSTVQRPSPESLV